ncbi:hypothetical protein DVK02_19550, partial [Halobellus sp. Atlit-31R]
MKKPTSFLVCFSAFAAMGISLPVAALPTSLPQPSAMPELAGAAMITLAALAFALLLGRRSQVAQERGNALERELQAERGAHADVENALAGSHEVLCRLVRQQETVRES